MRLHCKLRDLIKHKSEKTGQRITYADVTTATGLYASTLTRLANDNFEMVGRTTIERLCEYFECEVSDLFVLTQ
ncbi:MAG: helix-turn-helix transcriptional regulator [Chloroflexi bacterium]|nr:helix-turn-helix transcriptional regulator [Chloroflexota bacterium]MBU1746674.1 helix-turn-helix transcriptional regulator [Chloroflexota bacterium]